MGKKYLVRPYRTGDEEEIVKLLEIAFDGWPRFDLQCSSLDYWEWKYKHNPLNLSFIAVAVSNDKIIGCSHSILSKIKFWEEVLLCGSGYDAAVHRDYRGMGVFTKLMKSRDELRENSGINFALRESSNPFLRKSHSKIYPPFPHSIFFYVRIHDVALHLSKIPTEHALINKYGFHLAKTFNELRNKMIRIKPSCSALKISTISKFDDRIEDFWREIKNQYSFIVERNKVYLNWRYFDPRGGNYSVKIVEEDDKILGYIVLRINRFQKDYPIGFIVDLLAVPDRLDVIHALIEDAVEYFDKNKINIALCLIVKNHPYIKMLNKNGFINSRYRQHLFYELYTKIEDELERIKKSPGYKIYFSLGDQDWI